MIYLILGNKGSGKTKRLIDLVNAAVEKSNGNVVCIEKERLLTYNVNYRARLVETDHYGISGYDAFYGFLSGIIAGDHDITDVLVDATLKIGGKDYEALACFLEKVAKLSKIAEQDFTFTVSADEAELPAKIFEFCEKI
jgi:energy-coupling factor transporter ATP-binding protein EcfA2